MRSTFRLAFCLMVAAGLTPASRLLADDSPGSIHFELAAAAKSLLQAIDGANQKHVELGQFVPVGASDANGGPGLRVELLKALVTLRPGVVEDKAPLALQGKYLKIDDPADRSTAADKRLIVEKLMLELIDKGTGNVIVSMESLIRRTRDIAAIEGTTAAVDPNADSRAQNNALRDRADHPETCLDDGDASKIRSMAGSSYALQLAIEPTSGDSKAKPRKATLEKGQAFVAIDKGELYELVFSNDSDDEVGVSIKIDGIDVFAFSDDRDAKTGQPKFNYYIVPKHGKLTVPGWHKTNDPKRNDTFLRFLVTEYGQGAAGKFPAKAQGQIGVITLAVGKSHSTNSGKAKSGAETGFGPPVKGSLAAVERTVDPPHDFISVRYLRQ